jgi:hypothetical protein
MKNFENTLKGGDLRSIGKANDIVKEVNNKNDFDSLFTGLFHEDRKVVMRAADAIEKITITNPEYLADHKKEILGLLQTAKHIELKWHLALLISRLALTEAELGEIWQILTCSPCRCYHLQAKKSLNGRILNNFLPRSLNDFGFLIHKPTKPPFL